MERTPIPDGALPTSVDPATLPAPDLDGETTRVVLTTRGIPVVVLDAYHQAVRALADSRPDCHLPLPLLAAIGKVESNHARGGQVDTGGTTLTPILGPVLDGAGSFAAIEDTDRGNLDGDPQWDRAVGPMQFIPGTWARWRSDANRDGKADPHNVFDAAQTAGSYLCATGGDLRTVDGAAAAILRYNRSAKYLDLVLAWEGVYNDGAITGLPASAEPPAPTEAPPPSMAPTTIVVVPVPTSPVTTPSIPPTSSTTDSSSQPAPTGTTTTSEPSPSSTPSLGVPTK
ncbi:lytic transglycosylase domain-containing protein [Amycolatopsis sp. SID8362]|uniref:lytic transglycosylase domain-containing protein n=1 Tax=Amycolatopsis sp. SID8362 TaxID=2690346 RepID=UPI001368B0A6|nr:lytic transglycosylase domain-containing protein [Amycolatopsis sp. SID8362]NBH06085.1 lytic transglycosylase [Amycolatopsis sp. SID8362]NED42784.1 lytic transglycosylase domain-containing protein [Amycolatopsis sp. SID8362]